jgi:hypothetical protein
MQLTVEACPGRAYVAINDSSVDVLGQVTGDTQLSLLSAKNAGHTGLNWITQAVFSTSTCYAFAGHVISSQEPGKNG